MGNNSSTDEYSTNKVKEIMSDFKCLGERNDPQYGNIRIYQSKQQPLQRIYMSSKVFQNKQEHQHFIQNVSKRKKINDPAVSELIGFHNMVDENMCGNTFQLNLYGEWYENNLQKEIDLRNDEVEYFQESDIIYIMATICRVMSQFETQDIVHGDIRPNQIIITQQANLKLTHHSIAHPMKSNYLKTLVVGDKAYLPPELMIALDQKQIDPQHDRNKTDIYSLGMMMLYIMTLIDPSSSCYNYLNNTLDQNDVNNLIQLALKRYSQNLVVLVQKMLSIQPTARLNFTYYHNQIQQMYPIVKDCLTLKRETEQDHDNTSQNNQLNTNPTNQFNSVNNDYNSPSINNNNYNSPGINSNPINSNIQNSPDNNAMFSVHQNNAFNIRNDKPNIRQSGQYQQGINFQNRQFNINRNQDTLTNPNNNQTIQSPSHNFNNNQEEEIVVNENKVDTQPSQNQMHRQSSNQWHSKDINTNTDEQQSQQSQQQSYQQYQTGNQNQQPTTPIANKQQQFMLSPQSIQNPQYQQTRQSQSNNIFNQPSQTNRLQNYQQKVQIQQQFQSPNRTLDQRDAFKSPQRIIQSPQNNFISSPNYSQNPSYQRPPINTHTNTSGLNNTTINTNSNNNNNQVRNSGFTQNNNQVFNTSTYQQPKQYSINSNASSIYQPTNQQFQQPNDPQIYRKQSTNDLQSMSTNNQPKLSNQSSIVSQQNYPSRYVYNQQPSTYNNQYQQPSTYNNHQPQSYNHYQPQNYQSSIRTVTNNNQQFNSNSQLNPATQINSNQLTSPNRTFQNPTRQSNSNYPSVQMSAVSPNRPPAYQTDLDRRVQMAIQNSQNAIARNYNYH